MKKASVTQVKEIRGPRWPAAVSTAGALVLGISGVGAWWTEGLSWSVLLGCALSLLCILGAIDTLTTRVELREDSILIVANLRARVYPKSSFVKVAWAEGAPAALQLQEGNWVFLPKALPVGLGPANTLKAWLKASSGVAA
jgi:hypothetical protein